MDRATFDDYIARFNRRDPTTFTDYIDPNARVLNGLLEINGADGMKAHYAWIWKSFNEELSVLRFVSDDDSLAIEMKTHFTVNKDDDESPFGVVKVGECFDYHGVIMYQMVNNKFTDTKVSYLSFSRTGLDGKTIQMGIPH
jgi:hypothetical protein